MRQAPLFFTCRECDVKQYAGVSAPHDFHEGLVDEFSDVDPDVEVERGEHVRSAEAHRCQFCGHLDTYEVAELTFDATDAQVPQPQERQHG